MVYDDLLRGSRNHLRAFMIKLGATRHEGDQMLSVTTHMGGDSSRIYAACLL
jgi:hypothetical protein